MNKKIISLLVAVLILTCGNAVFASEGWNFALGINYVDGLDELVDRYEENMVNEGYYSVDTVEIPVGLSFTPYYQYENGMQICAGIGPIVWLTGDAEHFEFPARFGVGYSLFKDADMSPYLRGGLSYHFASGDYVEGSSAGFFGSVGVELAKFDNGGSIGIEFTVDTAEVDVEVIDNSGFGGSTEGIKTTEMFVGVFFNF